MRYSRAALFCVAAALGLIAAGLVVSPARNSLADAVAGALGVHGAPVVTRPAVVPPNPRNSANALVAAAVRPLATAQTRTAVQLASKDPDLARLFRGVGYQVAHVGPWTTEGTSRLIGVVLFVTLAHPANIGGLWPTAVYDPTERTFPPYAERHEKFIATGVRRALIEVDLTRRRVAGVVPLDYTAIRR